MKKNLKNFLKRSYLKRSNKPLERRTSLNVIGGGKVRIFKYNKFSNTSSRCNQEHSHDSIGEAQYCNSLELLKRAKEIRSFKIQQSYDMTVNGKTICKHIVDFLVTNKEGKVEVHEVKGFATNVWNLKRKLFEALYPSIPYIVIKV